MLCTLVVRQNRKAVQIFFFLNARDGNVGKRDGVARKNNIMRVKQKTPKSISTPYTVRRCGYKKIIKGKGVVWKLLSSYNCVVTAHDALNYWIFSSFFTPMTLFRKNKNYKQTFILVVNQFGNNFSYRTSTF